MDIEEDEEEEEEEEVVELLLLVVALLVKGVMEGVGMSSATFCFFVLLLKPLMVHLRTDASSSSSATLGWAAAKCGVILFNQTVVVHWGHSQDGWCEGWPWLPLTCTKRWPMAATGKW